MEYQLKRMARSRSIKVRLDGNNQIVVTAPLFVSKRDIEQFLNRTQDWIERQKQRVDLRQLANPTINWEEKVVNYLGKLYYIKFTDHPDKVRLENGYCQVSPVTLQEQDVPQTLVKWLKLEAEKYIRERVLYWSDKMSASCHEIGFGQQTSRWGSCTGDNRLRFNWRLIHFSPQVIDYVVIHELSHTIHHDHSDRFWQLVEQYCPTYKDQRKFLKRQSIAQI